MNIRGYTLIEMVLVIVIIGILASVAMQSLTKSESARRLEETMAEMEDLARAIGGDSRLISNGSRTDFGYVGDIGALPSSLDDLVANPGGYATWKGPYFRNSFAENTEDYKRDAWNNPYTYSGGVTISSNTDGPIITKQFGAAVSDFTSNSIKGIILDGNGFPPADSAPNVFLTVFYPDGAGSATSSTSSPSKAGEFSFDNMIPSGIHQIRAIVTGATDTVYKYLAVNPGSVIIADIIFPGDLWGGSSGAVGRLEYVAGTAAVSGQGNRNIQFDIQNTGASPVSVSSIILTYTSVPQSYYQKVLWGGSVLYNNPRLGSGDTAVLSSPQTVNPSETVTVEIQNFWDSPAAGGSVVNMSGVSFQVTFSNGDVITFATP